MATTDAQVSTPSPTRGDKAKNALTGVRKFLEEKLAVDKPQTDNSLQTNAPPPPINTSPQTEAGQMAVAVLKSGHFRRAYGPDFLEMFANKYMTSRRDRNERRKLKVITGSKAEKFYRKFIRSACDETNGPEVPPPTKPVVFAFASNNTEKKGVKFYKTWRSIKDAGRNPEKAHHVPEHKLGFLDAEFDRVLGFLDSEFNRMSSASVLSVVSLPFLQTVALDTGRSKQDDSPLRTLKLTNPDSASSGPSSVNTPLPSGELQGPTIDTSPDSQDQRVLPTTTPEIIVSGADTPTGLATPVADAHSLAAMADEASTADQSHAEEADQTPAQETLSIPSPRRSVERRKRQNRSQRAPSDGTASESYMTDASSEGNASFSGSHDRTRGSLSNPPQDVSEFTIVLLEEGKDYSLVRRDRKRSPHSHTEAQQDATPWWADLGQLPPSRPRTPRLFNPSDNVTTDVSPWWTPHVSPSKTPKSQVPDKSKYRSRPHPEVGSTTWKKFMEPVGYPTHPSYEPAAMAMEHVGAISWQSPENAVEYLSPIGYYPSPSIYTMPYASPVPSWKSYMDGSPMASFSDHSEHIHLPGVEIYAPLEPAIFADATGYPYASG